MPDAGCRMPVEILRAYSDSFLVCLVPRLSFRCTALTDNRSPMTDHRFTVHPTSSRSICSRLFPFVSGSFFMITKNPSAQIPAYSQ